MEIISDWKILSLFQMLEEENVRYHLVFFSEQKEEFLLFKQGKGLYPFLLKENLVPHNKNFGMSTESLLETVLLRRLNHVHILPLLKVFIQPRISSTFVNDCKLLFPFYPNTLYLWRKSKQNISQRIFLRIARQLLEVVDYLHNSTRGGKDAIIHRNLHPGSIWVDVQSKYPYEVEEMERLTRKQQDNELFNESDRLQYKEILQNNFEKKRFEHIELNLQNDRNEKNEIVDIFVGGFHHAGFMVNNFSQWNLNCIPFVIEKQSKILPKEEEEEEKEEEEKKEEEKIETKTGVPVLEIEISTDTRLKISNVLSFFDAKRGDLFAVGLILYFLLTGELLLLDKTWTIEKNLQNIYESRMKFFYEAETQLEQIFHFNEPELSVDMDIKKFVLHLLNLGKPQDPIFPKVYNIKELLQNIIFHNPISIQQATLPLKEETKTKEKKIFFPTTQAQPFRSLELNGILGILKTFSGKENLLDKRINQLEYESIKIPKSYFQIGPLTKPGDEYTDEEWRVVEKEWYEKSTQAISHFLQLYNLTLTANKETPTLMIPALTLEENMKYCFCFALALFRMIDKKSLQISPKETVNELHRFVVVCWLIAQKLCEFIYFDEYYEKIFADKVLKPFIEQLDPSKSTNSDQIEKLILNEEKQIVENLNFYLWSPVHISVWCKRNLETLQGNAMTRWMIGNVDNEKNLLDLVIFYLLDAKVKMICFDIQNFLSKDNTQQKIILQDIKDFDQYKSIKFEMTPLFCQFLLKLIQANIFICFISQFDPLQLFQPEKEQKQQKTSLIGKAYRKAYESVFNISPTYTLLLPTAFTTVDQVLDKKNSLLFKLQEFSQVMNTEEKVCENLKQIKILDAEMYETPTSPPSTPPVNYSAFFLSFNWLRYLEILHTELKGNEFAFKLWNLLHNAFDGTYSIRDYLTETETQENVTTKTLQISSVYRADEKVKRKGIGKFITRQIFKYLNKSLSFELPEDIDPIWELIVEEKLLSSITKNNFSLHLAVCLEMYSKLHSNQTIQPNQCMLCTGDQKAIADAEQYCFQTFFVSGQWTKENFQTFTVFKKYQTTVYQCKIKE